jgi:hypothetical protein
MGKLYIGGIGEKKPKSLVKIDNLVKLGEIVVFFISRFEIRD